MWMASAALLRSALYLKSRAKPIRKRGVRSLCPRLPLWSTLLKKQGRLALPRTESEWFSTRELLFLGTSSTYFRLFRMSWAATNITIFMKWLQNPKILKKTKSNVCFEVIERRTIGKGVCRKGRRKRYNLVTPPVSLEQRLQTPKRWIVPLAIALGSLFRLHFLKGWVDMCNKESEWRLPESLSRPIFPIFPQEKSDAENSQESRSRQENGQWWIGYEIKRDFTWIFTFLEG